MIKDVSWMSNAPCRGKTELFFSNSQERMKQRRIRERQAIDICKTCPHIVECREYARLNREYGIWGGETEEQRFASGYLPIRFRGKVKRIIKE